MDIKELILESNLINFVIALLFIAYLLMKLIPESTKKRKAEIQKDLIEAQKAKEEAQLKLEELNKEIENAKLEAVQIVESAKSNAQALQEETMKEARLELDRLNKNSEKEISMHKEMAINTIKEQISQLTMQNLEKSLLEKKSEIDQLIKSKLKKDLSLHGKG